MKWMVPIAFSLLLSAACQGPERNCGRFHNGTFTFTAVIEGQEQTTTFVRQDETEIDYFAGQADTASVRWINDCEYIVRKLNPRNRLEAKPVHMKILSTTENSYTFEYGIVGEARKERGTAKIAASQDR